MKAIKSKFLSLSAQDALKAFWTFLISTVISVAGDAVLQAYTSGSYSLSAIHWQEVGLAILVAVISYLQKQFVTNSKGEFLKKEPKEVPSEGSN